MVREFMICLMDWVDEGSRSPSGAFSGDDHKNKNIQRYLFIVCDKYIDSFSDTQEFFIKYTYYRAYDLIPWNAPDRHSVPSTPTEAGASPGQPHTLRE
ncbi:MAG: hypothetical protein M5R41_08545 [Bacteroidia bacterium]|nr:hypothetical protein [Bacteroidia bacterium]